MESKQKATSRASKSGKPVSQSYDEASWRSSLKTACEESNSWSFPPTPWWEVGEEVVPGPDRTLEVTSRLDDDLAVDLKFVRTDSKRNLHYLRCAYKLAQQAIHKEWCKDGFGGGRTQDFRDGPHVIALGRNELISWLGEFPNKRLARNGHSYPEVHDAIFGVTPP